MDDVIERAIEIVLSIVGTGGALYGLFEGMFSGQEAMIIIIASYALFQSTSIVKMIHVVKEENSEDN